jgi:D-glycerate 3-kinase
MNISAKEQAFLERNQLPPAYLDAAKQWFSPIVDSIVADYNHNKTPRVIGINGCQGSGKSTLADYLCTAVSEQLNLKTVALSLDDFYLTKSERNELARQVHPLLATRGVPGTHDVELAISCVKNLLAGEKTLVTRFDKSIDDRVPQDQLSSIEEPVGLIVLEGWCLGALPQKTEALTNAINALENEEDADAVWRSYVNQALTNEYPDLFNLVDELIMLKAPSFDTVFNWRLEQEQKLVKRLEKEGLSTQSGIMNEQQIRRFISYFERVTENSLQEMPQRADHLFTLGLSREITCYTQN